jgi:PIN domain nuclease of toxin-antitoxin system
LRLLIDTHILLWQFLDDPRFSGQVRALTLDPRNDILVSDTSIWEIAIKVQIGKLRLAIADIEAEIVRQGYERLPITAAHLRAVATFPRHHSDPFDHLLIVQANAVGATMLTLDKKIRGYPVRLAL